MIKMGNKIIISVLSIFANMALCFAQDVHLSKSQERRMNSKAIDLVMRLENSAEISTRQNAREFIRLFESDSTLVFCDIYSSSDFLHNISVTEYVENFFTSDGEYGFHAFSYEFRDIKNLGWSYNAEDQCWIGRISMYKSLSYFDLNYIYYPLIEQNPDKLSFMQEIFIKYDKSGNCKISLIVCRNIYQFKEIDEKYYVIQINEDAKDAGRDSSISFGTEKVRYNEFGQGYAPQDDFDFGDDDMKVTMILIDNTDRYRHVKLKYKPKRVRLRIRNEYSPLYAYNISTPTSNKLTSESSAYNVGIDIGYAIPASKKFKLGINTGIGVTFSSINLQTESMKYSYRTSNNTGEYVRTYNIDLISQGAKFMDLTVPVYFSPEFRIRKMGALVFEIGVKAYFNTNAITTPFHVEGNVSGRYDDGTLIPVGENGIGYLNRDYSKYVSLVTFKRRPIDISVIGSIGFDINLYAKTLYLQMKAGYEYGLMDSYESDNKPFFRPSPQIYPLVWDGREGHRHEVVFRSLADCVSFRRQALWFSLGFMIKL